MTEPKWYDLTLSVDKIRQSVPNEEPVELVEKWMETMCERYVIGIETGENGYEHLQCRIVLKKPMSMKDMVSAWSKYGHVSPSHTRNFDYCEKEGKFIRSWEKPLRKYVNGELLEWQELVIKRLKGQSSREILCVIDEKGATGKTWLRKYLVANHLCTAIPTMEKAEDVMSIAMAKPSNGYVLDLPRAEKLKDGMYSALEMLKDGWLYDKRYQWKEKWIEPPLLLVFTNTIPQLKKLSKDRWRFITICADGTIKESGGETETF